MNKILTFGTKRYCKKENLISGETVDELSKLEKLETQSI